MGALENDFQKNVRPRGPSNYYKTPFRTSAHEFIRIFIWQTKNHPLTYRPLPGNGGGVSLTAIIWSPTN